MRGRTGSVVPEISVSGKFCHMNTSSRLTGWSWTTGGILAVRMASSCIACCIFHIITIPFNCSDTAVRVSEAMVGQKVRIFVFRHAPCLLCFLNLVPELVPWIFGLFSSRKPGWYFSYEPKAKIVLVTGPARSTRLMWRHPNLNRTFLCNALYNTWTRTA